MIVEAAAAGVAAAGLAAYAVRHPRCEWLAASYYRGPADRRRVALTFDDGPSEGTPPLLDLLARYDAAATFFQCGVHVRRLPEIAREVRARGHETGNHTNTHPLLALSTRAFMAQELMAAQQAFADVTDHQPRLFRAPYGVRWPGLGGVQKRLGLTGVMWTVMGLDWKLGAREIAERVVRGSENGAIICLHDGRGMAEKPDVRQTIQAADGIMARLADRGFQFATVSDLLCLS